MMTSQITRETVTLESIGAVDISHIYVPIDDFAHRATRRPSPGYHEVAILWGAERHCYIVDSNLTDETAASQLAEWLSDAPHLAQFMVHMFATVKPYEWE
jgi:hypothetical protein